MEVSALQAALAVGIPAIGTGFGVWINGKVRRIELGHVERTTSFQHMESVVSLLEKQIVALTTRLDGVQRHVDKCEEEKREAAAAAINLTRENDQLREMNTRLTRMKDSAVTNPPPPPQPPAN